ncbi:MAG: transketolase [Xanthobacteraceae bacterium]
MTTQAASPHPHSATAAAPRHDIDLLAIDTIRTLTIDAVQKAQSGHAGTPMGIAPAAYTLWQDVLRYDPADPLWANRDRVVLSAGHASMLLYALIHLAGVRRADGRHITAAPAVSLDDIKNFRQIDSVTPGHPEYGRTTGVETTTGPLGQGCGNSVGMAIASRWLGERYNRDNFTLFDFDVYTICSDGDLMEGVASEAASLAGHLRLANLCWIYDSNTVTIEGHTDITFTEDVENRFRGYRWNVMRLRDANDTAALRHALDSFRQTFDRPTLIIVDSIIGYGSPHKQNTAGAHSDPLGEEEVRLTKRFYGWPEDAQFLVPDGVYERFRNGIGRRGRTLRDEWMKSFAAYKKEYPQAAREIETMLAGGLPADRETGLPIFPADAKGVATRDASGKILDSVAKHIPWLIGGSADLSPSTKTAFEKDDAFEADNPGGRVFHFGVREHAMGAIVNGLVLSKLRAFGATFLTFSDYMRPSIRLAALMEIPVFHVFTHDSIGLGEDGPTHQPIEQLVALRAIPNMIVLRPADANEVSEAYKVIFAQSTEPVCLVLSRQKLPVFDRSRYAAAAGMARGAYTMADAEHGEPEVILIASGSEVQLCIDAYEALKREKIAARVVSMPSWELFEQQDQHYRDAVLPPHIMARVAVEMGVVIGWDRYAGPTGTIIGMHSFGASGPIGDVLAKFGFVPDKILQAAKTQVADNKGAKTSAAKAAKATDRKD